MTSTFAPATTERVAIYARISDDPQGQEAGVKRQIEDARARAAQRGWTVVHELQDNDITALTGKHRPGYQAAMRAAEAGEIDRIVVYHTGRLWRNRIERAQGIDTLRRTGVSLTAVKGPELDLSTAAGRVVAGVLGEFDTMESEIKSERVTRAALQRAEDGAPNGAIPYGWLRQYDHAPNGDRIGGTGRDVQHPEEARVVKAICERLLAGGTLIEVTAWLNEQEVAAPGKDFNLRNRDRGLQNPTGARWGKSSVKKLAIRPANAGLRKYHAGRPDERLLEARIEPIITRDQWDRLVAKFGAQPGAAATRPGGRVHLLSYGIGRCGVCGSVLRVAQNGTPGSKQALYACEAKGCVGRRETSVDTYLAAELIEVLSDPDVAGTLVDSEAADAAYSRADALRGKLRAATADFNADLITREQLLEITADLRPKIAQADRAAENAAPTVPWELIRHVAGSQAGERFAGLPVAQKYILLEAFVSEVRIMPTRRGPGFEPKDVHIVWRQAR